MHEFRFFTSEGNKHPTLAVPKTVPILKVKGKIYPRTGQEDPEEE
jgi:hypothetical protein